MIAEKRKLFFSFPLVKAAPTMCSSRHQLRNVICDARPLNSIDPQCHHSAYQLCILRHGP